MEARHVGAGSPRLVEGAQAACRPRSTLVRRAALALATLAVAILALASRADAYVYWASSFTDSIGRANRDGTGANESFITGASNPTGVAVDGGVAVDASHLYWTSYDPDNPFLVLYHGPLPTRIGRANLNGTGGEENFIATLPSEDGVAVDEAHVWWAYSAPKGTGPTPTAASALEGAIERANLDGTGAEFVIEPDGVFPYGIAVDDTYVYWTQGTSIGRARLDGSRATTELITGIAAGAGVAVDALGPPPSNKFSFGGAKVKKKRGSTKLTVKVAGPGELKLARTKTVKGAHERAAQSGEAKLTIKPRGKAKKRLNKRGKAKVKAKVTYTPDGGASDTKSKKIKPAKR